MVPPLSDHHTRSRVNGKQFLLHKRIPLSIIHFSVHSHPGYEVGLLLNICVIYYMVTMLDVYDTYFYFYTFYIVMRLKICCYMASKIGDFSSEFGSDEKQRELLLRLWKTHEDVNRLTFPRRNNWQTIFIEHFCSFTADFSKSFVILFLGEALCAMALLTLALLINALVEMQLFFFSFFRVFKKKTIF